LIYPPLREAEWRFCAVGSPAWMVDGGGPTEQDRSEGTPSLSEGPDARGERFFAYFF
jgi:hypothetical protein